MIMPELPEVENVRLALSDALIGKEILSVEVLRSQNIDTPLPDFLNSLPHKKFVGISRRGKYLLFNLDDGRTLLAHLRMEGKFFVEDENEEAKKHDLIVFHLSGSSKLVYNDTRRFGRMGLYDQEQLKLSPLSRLGKEPFEYNEEEFASLLKRKNKPIKEVLLNQTLIAGIGNIYADESLFESKISPFCKASSLTKEQSTTLLRNIKDILSRAINLGGSTIRSYHPKEGVSGSMQNKLRVYGKSGKPCPNCGFPLKKEILGGRGTTYCPHCQRKPNSKLVLGVCGPIHCGKSTVSGYLKSKGFLVFDADKEVRSLYSLNNVKRRLLLLFGKDAIKDGSADFSYLRLALAKDKAKKEQLNAYLYPLVKKRAASFISKQKEGSKIVLDVPLLFKAKMEVLCDATLLLLSDEAKRAERLQKEGRDAKVLLQVNADYPLEEAKRKVSFIIENNGGVDELKAKIDALPLFD